MRFVTVALATAAFLAPRSVLAVPTPSGDAAASATASSTTTTDIVNSVGSPVVPASLAAPTPKSAPPPPPTYLPFHVVARDFPELANEPVAHLVPRDFIEADEPAELDARGVAADMMAHAKVVRDFVGPDLATRAVVQKAKTVIKKALNQTCLGSQTTAAQISSLFYYGGAGTTVFLCNSARIKINETIFFSAAGQVLSTIGYPYGNERASITVMGAQQSCAIFAAIGGGDRIEIRNIQVNGNRAGLGIIVGGIGLIEMGGDNSGQSIHAVRAYEPRGWTCLHAIEGTGNSCRGMWIMNNQIGPSGHAPSGVLQFRKRDNTGTYAPGQWADGISLACAGSTVTGNTITDATDGGIVIFGAPGSKVSGNTIKAVNRQLLGGINLVDWGPFQGSFEGTVVSGNTIVAQSSMIKLGIALGGMSWGVDNRTASRTYAGTVKNNVFKSGSTGYFGYAISMAGHDNATFSGNVAKGANFGGVASPACFPQYPLPDPQPFVADEWNTPGKQVSNQAPFTLGTIVIPICKGPGAIFAKSVSL